MGLSSRLRGLFTWQAVLGILLVVIGFVLPPSWLPVPVAGWRAVRALTVLLAGYLIVNAVERRFEQIQSGRDRRRSGLLRLLLRLVLYVVVGLAVVAQLGPGIAKQFTFGGALLTVVIGLAGQTLLGNLLSGMVLVVWRPFEIGDQISVMSWQMPALPATFPHETLPLAHRFAVQDINLMHTICRADDGQITLIPNGIVLQGVVRNHSRSGLLRVRVRGEAEVAIPPPVLWERLQQLAAELSEGRDGNSGTVRALLADLSATSTAFVLEAWVRGDADQHRSRLVLAAAQAVDELRAQARQKADAPAEASRDADTKARAAGGGADEAAEADRRGGTAE